MQREIVKSITSVPEINS